MHCRHVPLKTSPCTPWGACTTIWEPLAYTKVICKGKRTTFDNRCLETNTTKPCIFGFTRKWFFRTGNCSSTIRELHNRSIIRYSCIVSARNICEISFLRFFFLNIQIPREREMGPTTQLYHI